MIKNENLIDYTNLFSPNKFEMNDKIIPEYFKLLETFMNRF